MCLGGGSWKTDEARSLFTREPTHMTGALVLGRLAEGRRGGRREASAIDLHYLCQAGKYEGGHV